MDDYSNDDGAHRVQAHRVADGPDAGRHRCDVVQLVAGGLERRVVRLVIGGVVAFDGEQTPRCFTGGESDEDAVAVARAVDTRARMTLDARARMTRIFTNTTEATT